MGMPRKSHRIDPYHTRSVETVDLTKSNCDDMYTTIDQNRPDNLYPQNFHLHMHQLCCPCNNIMYPYYTSAYQPPILATPYPPQPLPRPYNLHHYQYTQFNLGGYNVPVGPQIPQSLPVSATTHMSSTGSLNMAFGPPPRDRRNLDKPEIEVSEVISSISQIEQQSSKDDIDHYTAYLPPISPSTDLFVPSENSRHDSLNTNIELTEDYVAFLEQGCIFAEKIAIRNQHRPCFKNIQNLCNRTRSEILKPNTTVSNIHSQGIPWATKDFIYAYVRLVNCWYILKGYLDNKEGSLGKIDKELSPEFQTCYTAWEKNTKELSHHLIQVFSNLDVNVTNPNPHSVLRSKTHSSQASKKSSQTELPTISGSSHVQTRESSIKAPKGILHIPTSSSGDLAESHKSDETENSPHDEDSDCDNRVYMKPGSYSVPKKSSGSPQSIEFLDKAQNVYKHTLNAAYSGQSSERAWKRAQDLAQELHAQQVLDKIAKDLVYMNRSDGFPQIDLDQRSDVENWLNNNHFEIEAEDGNVTDLFAGNETLTKCVKFLKKPKNDKSKSDDASKSGAGASKSGAGASKSGAGASKSGAGASKTYRKKSDGESKSVSKLHSTFKKHLSNNFEYKRGGLTEAALIIIQNVLRELEHTELAVHIAMDDSYRKMAEIKRHNKSYLNQDEELEMKNPTNLTTIAKKVHSGKYRCLNELVHDFRHIIVCADIFYEAQPEIIQNVEDFCDKFENMIADNFPSIDFQLITGEASETIGPLIMKRSGSKNAADGDGDH